MKVLRGIFLFIRFVWELPQNLSGMGLLVFLQFKKRVLGTENDNSRCFIETKNTGVSLGSFVFWTKAANRFPGLVNDCRMHEYGHTIQSLIFGPSYLVVIGIPSLARVLYRWWYLKKYRKHWQNYFKGFPENWADKLGGVVK
jgi:hypothetical protein